MPLTHECTQAGPTCRRAAGLLQKAACCTLSGAEPPACWASGLPGQRRLLTCMQLHVRCVVQVCGQVGQAAGRRRRSRAAASRAPEQRVSRLAAPRALTFKVEARHRRGAVLLQRQLRCRRRGLARAGLPLHAGVGACRRPRRCPAALLWLLRRRAGCRLLCRGSTPPLGPGLPLGQRLPSLCCRTRRLACFRLFCGHVWACGSGCLSHGSMRNESRQQFLLTDRACSSGRQREGALPGSQLRVPLV